GAQSWGQGELAGAGAAGLGFAGGRLPRGCAGLGEPAGVSGELSSACRLPRAVRGTNLSGSSAPAQAGAADCLCALFASWRIGYQSLSQHRALGGRQPAPRQAVSVVGQAGGVLSSLQRASSNVAFQMP